jgi:uncharacterized protein
MKYVLFYESTHDARSKTGLHYLAHRARFEDFHARGELLMIGAFAGSPHEGEMAVFTSRKAAESFASGDPFVLNGIISSWRIRAWDEVLNSPNGTDRPSS